MTVVYDSVVPVAKSIISFGLETVKQKGDWFNMNPSEGYMVNQEISETLHIKIKKDIGKLHI